MKLPSSIETALGANNGMLSMRQLSALGCSRTSAGRYVRAGLLERAGHGLYRRPSDLDDSLFALLFRSPALVASHGTALFLNGLAESAPERWSVTSSHGREPPPSVRAACLCFYVKPERLELGLCLRRTPFGNEVRCYDAERTVCDLVRSRRRLDEELVLAGLRNWGASPGRDPARLARYARALGVFDRVKAQVEVLL